MAEKRVLTIEADYCKDWGIQDAIREIIQNGLDTGTKIAFGLNGNLWEIVDNGIGVKLSDFIIGRSSKRDDKNVIGQFGEGLKIGCLVLAREGRQVRIISLGKSYDFSIQYDDTWQEKLLTIDVDDSPIKQKGTAVSIECSEEEIKQARSLFMQLNPQPVIDKIGYGSDVSGSEILETPGIIYVNGLAVTKIEALYGYNFHKKELVNRDRAAIGITQIKNCVAEALSYTTNEDIISNLLRTAVITAGKGTTPTEFDVMFTPRKNTWLKVLKSLFGTKVCLSSHNPQVDLAAIEKNWKVLELPWNFWYSLQRILPKSESVIKDTKRIVPFSRLTAEQKEFFNKGKGIADELAGEAGLKPYPVKIFVDKEKKDDTRLFNFDQTGYYLNGVAGVCHETIKNRDLGKFVGTLLHEYTHGNCGHDDNSRDFENDLTDVISSLGLALITEKRKAKRVGLNYGLKRDLTS